MLMPVTVRAALGHCAGVLQGTPCLSSLQGVLGKLSSLQCLRTQGSFPVQPEQRPANLELC